ncbi:alpha/beta fold hydrolase [Streptomyces sp. NPDC059477]|uniref:alpha/beta fold hydrolase n=1 Tax=Streptomyces sp. NPDC059477 TaxID=3346847 RepID=UPI0036A33B03
MSEALSSARPESGRMGVRAPERVGRVRLGDGRGLGWAEWGPESGVPVLLCSGSATGRRLGLDTDAVAALGVRLVTVDRPGLGVSDALPGWTLRDWAGDIREFARIRGLGRFAAVGYSIGAPFALACAAAGLTAGVAVVSGTDELAHPAFAGLLEPEARFVLRRAAEDPAGAERLLAEAASAEALFEVVTGAPGEHDRRVFGDPGFRRAYRRALAEGFARGPGGYARETVLAATRWPFDPADIRVPADLWYSADDGNPFHSPDLGATLAARIPAARRHVLADAGTALLWTHAREILGTLLEETLPDGTVPDGTLPDGHI